MLMQAQHQRDTHIDRGRHVCQISCKFMLVSPQERFTRATAFGPVNDITLSANINQFKIQNSAIHLSGYGVRIETMLRRPDESLPDLEWYTLRMSIS